MVLAAHKDQAAPFVGAFALLAFPGNGILHVAFLHTLRASCPLGLLQVRVLAGPQPTLGCLTRLLPVRKLLCGMVTAARIDPAVRFASPFAALASLSCASWRFAILQISSCFVFFEHSQVRMQHSSPPARGLRESQLC